MTDFLLELRCEEIPARMQAGARAELEKLFRKQMDAAGVAVGEVTVWSTPRRLALIARGLPDSTEAVREETKGPKTSAPSQALDGFLRKTGLARDQLEERDGAWFAVVEKPGRQTREVLAAAIPAIVRGFSWPKSMRWGAASISTDSLRWVRPLSGIVAIFGEDLVECEVGGVQSGYATLGHRFHHDGPITIGGADDYQEKLRACHVIVDHEERAALIRDGAAKAAAEAGLTLVEDEGLVAENAGLTEWPVPLLGRFDAAFLDVPPEVIRLTARVNQKYFVLQESPPLGEVAARRADGGGAAQQAPSDPAADASGPPPPEGETRQLANAFVCTANIEAADGGAAIVDGNRKVLAARLADARFFWEQDRKVPLAEHAKKLERITFHEKLGTVADKVERVAKLARWLVEEGIVGGSSHFPATTSPLPSGEGPGVGGATSRSPNTHPQPLPSREGASLADLAEQAARLAKADLVTEMVGEFPELQGVMGGYYARAEGLSDEVADAIRDHYKPVGQGDEVPTAPVTVAVSLADKLDTLISFFAAKEIPSGSRDPYALRRAAISVISLIITNAIRASLMDVLFKADIILFDDLVSQSIRIDPKTKDVFDIVHAAAGDELQVDREANRLIARSRDTLLEIHKFPESVKQRIHIIASANDDGPVNLINFFADRLKVQQREAGVRHDLIDAVFALGNEDDLVRLLSRVKALQNFIQTEDGEHLLTAYKRAANILKKEDWRGAEGEIARTGEEDPLALVDDPDLQPVIAAKMAERHAKGLSYTPEPAEKDLIAALDSAEPRAAAAVGGEDFEGAMAALATLRAPIDRFFEEVTVNDDNPAKRAARLDLLARFRDAVHQVADFSRIEG